MRIIRLPFSEIGRLKEIEATPNPDPWVREAEQFVFGGELVEFARSYRDDLSIRIVEDDTRVVALGVTYPDPRFHAVRIGSIVVDHRSRRRGLGWAILRNLVETATTSGDTICWLVHPDNYAMLACSRRIKPRPDEASIDDGYVMFVAP